MKPEQAERLLSELSQINKILDKIKEVQSHKRSLSTMHLHAFTATKDVATVPICYPFDIWLDVLDKYKYALIERKNEIEGIFAQINTNLTDNSQYIK